MQKMKNSGYDEKFRLEVLKSSVNGYEKILEDGEKGVKPVYRSKEWKEKMTGVKRNYSRKKTGGRERVILRINRLSLFLQPLGVNWQNSSKKLKWNKEKRTKTL